MRSKTRTVPFFNCGHRDVLSAATVTRVLQASPLSTLPATAGCPSQPSRRGPQVTLRVTCDAHARELQTCETRNPITIHPPGDSGWDRRLTHPLRSWVKRFLDTARRTAAPTYPPPTCTPAIGPPPPPPPPPSSAPPSSILTPTESVTLLPPNPVRSIIPYAI